MSTSLAVPMKCGHRANAEYQGKPACAICCLTNPGATVIDDSPPDLTGRFAQCSPNRGCKTVPSSLDLAFFEYCGPGSPTAVNQCVCGYNRVAHEPEGVKNNRDPKTVIERGLCTGFRPRGPEKYDRYYCGCRGWD